MKELFTKQSMREKHTVKIAQILAEGKGVDAIVEYLMSRVGMAIAYERGKMERREAAQWSNRNASRNQGNGEISSAQ